MTGLETRCNELLPDLRQLAQSGSEQINPLAARDLGIQVVLFGHLAQHNQFVGGDLATGNARHNGIGAVFLHVGHKSVVGVLQRHVIGGQYVFVPAGRQN